MSSEKKNLEFNILLVDDRKENLLSLEELLQGSNRHFIKATSGAEALKAVLKHDNIGLILLDVQMPDMDGFEVAKLLKSSSKTKDISIILVSAINKEVQHMLRGFEEGAIDFIQKPLDPDVTRAKVDVFEKLYLYQSQLKNTVHDLEVINKQLEKFVYIVAHDLKSPLAGIIAMLSILETDDRVTNVPDVFEYINLLSSAANHLSGMISSILEYSKKSIDQQKVEEVSVGNLVKEISFLLFPPPNIKIVIARNMPVFITKKLKLQQAFQNLISNAIKYNDKKEGLIQIGFNDKDGWYEFYVKDNGPGIPKQDNEYIFKLFQTHDITSTREKSTGVGLNIVKMMIEEQGGKIRVESTPGEGSTFFFEWKK